MFFLLMCLWYFKIHKKAFVWSRNDHSLFWKLTINYLYILSNANRHESICAISFSVCHLASSCAYRLPVCIHLHVVFVHSYLSYPILWRRTRFTFFSHLLFVNFFYVLIHQCSIREREIAATEEWDDRREYKKKGGRRENKRKINGRPHTARSNGENKNSTNLWIRRISIYKLSTMNQSEWTLVSLLIAINKEWFYRRKCWNIEIKYWKQER